jgi:hypothetical protein
MVIENPPNTRASRIRRPRNLWPLVVAVMALIGAIGGRLLASH